MKKSKPSTSSFLVLCDSKNGRQDDEILLSVRAEQIEAVEHERPSFENRNFHKLVVTTKTKRKHAVITGWDNSAGESNTNKVVRDITLWLMEGASDNLCLRIG